MVGNIYFIAALVICIFTNVFGVEANDKTENQAFYKIQVLNSGFEYPYLDAGQIPQPFLNEGEFRPYNAPSSNIQYWRSEGNGMNFGLINPYPGITVDGSGMNSSRCAMVFFGGDGDAIVQNIGQKLDLNKTYRVIAYVGRRQDAPLGRDWRLQLCTYKGTEPVILKEVTSTDADWLNKTAPGTFQKISFDYEVKDQQAPLGRDVYVRFAVEGTPDDQRQVMLDEVEIWVAGDKSVKEQKVIGSIASGDGSIAVELTENGGIKSVTIAGKVYKLESADTIEACRMEKVSSRKIKNGYVFAKEMFYLPAQRKCKIQEIFTSRQDCIDWQIKVVDGGENPWSSAIITNLDCSAFDRYWTAWTQPRGGNAGDWLDPLKPMPFEDRMLDYGGVNLNDFDVFSYPMITVTDDKQKKGFSLLMAPTDTYLNMKMSISQAGGVSFTRQNFRISNSSPLTFNMHLIAHENDFRSALGWYTKKYPQYFEPVNPRAGELGGLSAYSEFTGELDAKFFHEIGFSYNWDASFDWPYLDFFLPETEYEEQWVSFRGRATSKKGMNEYAKWMKDNGFFAMNYFNIYEFGAYMFTPEHWQQDLPEKDMWKNPIKYADKYFKDGIMRWDKDMPWGKKGTPIGTWYGGVVMDPSDKGWQDFLVRQAKSHIDDVPEFMGLCVDRMDWIASYNLTGDDGVSWIDDKPAYSLAKSWNETFDRIGPMMHDAGKFLTGSAGVKRIDVMKHIDGINIENGGANALNQTALMSLFKPAVTWSHDPDGIYHWWLQPRLYLGTFCYASYPGADHSLDEEPRCQELQRLYGPLFNALRGDKRWVLIDNVIDVKDNAALANIYAMDYGFAVPVVANTNPQHELYSKTITVNLHKIKELGLDGSYKVDYVTPGGDWQMLEVKYLDDDASFDVRIDSSCAMVRFRRDWVEPDKRYFAQDAKISLNTVLKDAQIRYTIDGSDPALDSAVYTEPVKIDKLTQVAMAVFKDGKQAGKIIRRKFAKVPCSQPIISCENENRFFTDAKTVSFSVRMPEDRNGRIYYTTDGSDPTAASNLYERPFEVKQSCTVKARNFVDGWQGSFVRSVELYKIGPTPPKPDVYLSDVEIKELRSSRQSVTRDKNIIGWKLLLGGKEYSKGIGVWPTSELLIPIQPSWKRFVTVAGIDDVIKIGTAGAKARYNIFACRDEKDRGKALYLSEQVWRKDILHIDVEIPQGTKFIRLITDESTDLDHQDIANWCDAGFIID